MGHRAWNGRARVGSRWCGAQTRAVCRHHRGSWECVGIKYQRKQRAHSSPLPPPAPVGMEAQSQQQQHFGGAGASLPWNPPPAIRAQLGLPRPLQILALTACLQAQPPTPTTLLATTTLSPACSIFLLGPYQPPTPPASAHPA